MPIIITLIRITVEHPYTIKLVIPEIIFGVASMPEVYPIKARPKEARPPPIIWANRRAVPPTEEVRARACMFLTDSL